MHGAYSLRPGLPPVSRSFGTLGSLGVAFGLLALLAGGNRFAVPAPHGRVGDGHIIGLLTNGPTDLLFVAAGLALVLGARAHRTARPAALAVTGGLGLGALIALLHGDGVFGVFAANGVTEIVWASAAAISAGLSALPATVGRARYRREHGKPSWDPSDPRSVAGSMTPDETGNAPR